MDNNDLITAYELDMRRRSLSENTLGTFGQALRKLAAAFDLDTVKAEQIEQWLDGRELSARSRGWYISCFGGFYRWAIRARHLTSDPTADIQTPRTSRRLPRPIPDAELAEAVDLADRPMKAMLLLGALAGLRCMEIAGLRSDDVDLTAGTMRVIGKGDKERVVPVHPDIQVALEALPMPDRGPIFRSSTGTRVSADYVSHVVSRFLHETGSESSAHALRHRCLTDVYRATLDLRLTQEIAGHSSPATTATYAAANMTKATAAIGALRIGDKS